MLGSKSVGNESDRVRLLITADDLARNLLCTRSIVDSLAAGQVSAASIMANGPCFEDACHLVRERGVANRIGVHIALDEGPPLSKEMQGFCNSAGQLCIPRSMTFFSGKMLMAIESECRAQVQQVVDAGIRPTHLDSHRHIHTRWPIGLQVVKTAKYFGVPYVRPARNLARAGSAARRTYKWAFNRFLASQVDCARYFGDLVDFHANRYQIGTGSLVECMVHLDESPHGIACKQLLGSSEFLAFLGNFELVSHEQIRDDRCQ